MSSVTSLAQTHTRSCAHRSTPAGLHTRGHRQMQFPLSHRSALSAGKENRLGDNFSSIFGNRSGFSGARRHFYTSGLKITFCSSADVGTSSPKKETDRCEQSALCYQRCCVLSHHGRRLLAADLRADLGKVAMGFIQHHDNNNGAVNDAMLLKSTHCFLVD